MSAGEVDVDEPPCLIVVHIEKLPASVIAFGGAPSSDETPSRSPSSVSGRSTLLPTTNLPLPSPLSDRAISTAATTTAPMTTASDIAAPTASTNCTGRHWAMPPSLRGTNVSAAIAGAIRLSRGASHRAAARRSGSWSLPRISETWNFAPCRLIPAAARSARSSVRCAAGRALPTRAASGCPGMVAGHVAAFRRS